ncbi:hypothetical protein [Rhodocaloribacter sp.]
MIDRLINIDRQSGGDKKNDAGPSSTLRPNREKKAGRLDCDRKSFIDRWS